MTALHKRLTDTSRAWRAIPLLLLLLTAGTAHAAEDATRYELDVAIEPDTHRLEVHAVVELPPEFAGRTVEFLLTSALQVHDSDPAITRLPYEQGGFTGINGSSVVLGKLDAIARYHITLPEGSSTLKLSYSGTVNFPLTSPREEYARGIIETAGVVRGNGVYLAGRTLWYPYFSDELIQFALTAEAPDGWRLISQGNGSSRDNAGQAHWDSGGLVDEIYLVGGPLTLYEAAAGATAAQAYLRKPDQALADRYLSATARYIEMYRGLIGPYPYGKFALVENFWETGYGMPSFTLLGPQVIRFPFILTSSYPHEILHNWWGNSVFVDYPTGNWCEGLTAYMADHLMKEQAGQAAEYRRDTLKKYRDFVRDGRDFPITEFRSRQSAATEAVGYGKTLMGFHMLRRQLGDEAFKTALARFYREHRGSKAGFGDIRAQLEQVSGRDLKRFFEQWVERPGAADLRLDAVEVQQGTNGGYEVTGVLRQVQAGEKFELQAPLSLTTADGLQTQVLSVTGAATPFSFQTASQPQLLEVDPQFDLFRLLDARETAPSIGQVLGDRKLLAILPAAANEATRAAYREMVERWQSPTQDMTIVLDADIETDELPPDTAAWVLGRNNRFAQTLFQSDPALGLTVSDTGLRFQDQSIPPPAIRPWRCAGIPRTSTRPSAGSSSIPLPRSPESRPSCPITASIPTSPSKATNRPTSPAANGPTAIRRCAWTCAARNSVLPARQPPRPRRPANRSPNSPRSFPKNASNSTWTTSPHPSSKAAAWAHPNSKKQPPTSRPNSPTPASHPPAMTAATSRPSPSRRAKTANRTASTTSSATCPAPIPRMRTKPY